MNTAVRKIIAVCLAGTACLYASCGTSSSSNVKVKIIKEDLFDANRLIGGAYRYYQAGDTRKARELLSHCINNKMETGEAFLLMGKCFFAERDYVKASIAFKYAINNSPGGRRGIRPWRSSRFSREMFATGCIFSARRGHTRPEARCITT